jgi:hypothetical protein
VNRGNKVIIIVKSARVMGNQPGGQSVTHKLSQMPEQIRQEFQLKTAGLKQKIMNSSLNPNNQEARESEGQTQNQNRRRAGTEGTSSNSGGGKISSASAAHKKNSQNQGSGQKSVYQGIKIENDPLEREIYIKCPFCSYRVFDSGLENELQ